MVIGAVAGGVLVLVCILLLIVWAVRKANSLESRLGQLSSASPEKVERAREALEKAGAKAAPLLVTGLRGDSDQSRKHCLELLKKLGAEAKSELDHLRQGLADEREAVQIACATAIGYLGDQGRDAEADLLKLLSAKSRDVRSAAFQAVSVVGRPDVVMAALVARLKSNDSVARDEAFEWLGARGRKAASAVETLVALLDSKDPQTLKQAFATLERIGVADPKLLTLLAKILQTERDGRRQLAVRTLGGLGAEAVPLLTSLLAAECNQDQPEDPVLKKMRDDLLKKNPRLKDVPAFQHMPTRLPRHQNPDMIKLAAESLGRIGPAAKPALPTLRVALKFCTRTPTRTKLRIYNNGKMMEVDLGDRWGAARSAVQWAIGKIDREAGAT